METALYRCYDAGGRLLYVGIAADAERRMIQHERDHWHGAIGAIDIALYPDWRPAKDAETEAIKTEWPLWNIHESPWGGVVSDYVRQLDSSWRQDKWGCWYRLPFVARPPGWQREWTGEDERRFQEKCRHGSSVRRLTRIAAAVAPHAVRNEAA